jgi:hypothetical protein
MSVEVFGPIVDATAVERAVKDTLRDYMPDYLAEKERQEGVEEGSLILPKGYITVNEMQKWPEDRLPACLVVSPGMAGRNPKMEGDGTYRGWWLVGLGFVCIANNRERARELAKWYVAAGRTAILQHSSLGGFAEDVSWTGEQNNDLPDDADRTLAIGHATFEVEVRGLVNARKGKAAPSADPYDDSTWPTVSQTSVETTNMEDQ